MRGRILSYFSCCMVTASLCTDPAVARTTDPDWPCQQVKVEQLSVAAFWGQPPDPLDFDWQQDSAVAALVGEVTQRRLPIGSAVERIERFAEAVGPKKVAKLVALFAGVFETLNRERSFVLNGLDRFGQRQKSLATTLRDEGEHLRDMQKEAPNDDRLIAELTQRIMWDQQVFEARRQSARFACNIPGEIEQRLYQLAKAIEQQME